MILKSKLIRRTKWKQCCLNNTKHLSLKTNTRIITFSVLLTV